MPGEDIEDALAAGRSLEAQGLQTMYTQLGENVTDPKAAEAVSEHYLHVLDRIAAANIHGEVSVKPTQLGLDLGVDDCYANLMRIVEHAPKSRAVWIDMESSEYVDRTLEIYRRARTAGANVGVALQSYLYRTAEDVESLIPLGGAIRLVKGAYKESPNVAFPKKKDVDENFFELTKRLLSGDARAANVRLASGTHDKVLIRRTIEYAASNGIPKDAFEFAMLYGIQTEEQLRLAREGYRSIVLVTYGSYWFPWYMRRLAERPANIWFAVRNVFANGRG
jgi:proline dehydrogenase